jgi:membrane protein DedA with SNARE-associated domain
VLDALTEFITGSVADYGYLAVFVLMTLESACIPIPSEATMLFGGALASAGFAGDAQLSLAGVTTAGVLGNVVGSWLAYGTGAWGGRRMVDRYGRYLLILPHEVDRAHEWFERRGELAVFVSRLLPVIRTFISLPAGIARMPFWRFTAYTALGCVPFVFLLALGGRLAGAHWETVRNVLEPASWAIVAGLVVLLVVFVRRRWRRVRAAYAALDAAERERVAD